MIVRKSVVTPRGVFYGQYPQNLASNNGETEHVRSLAFQLGGAAVEVKLPAGRADVLTSEWAIEVEPVSRWRMGAQQAFAYAGQTSLTPVLALYGSSDYLKIYLECRDKMPDLRLMIWDGHTWVHCRSRRSAESISSIVNRKPKNYTDELAARAYESKKAQRDLSVRLETARASKRREAAQIGRESREDRYQTAMAEWDERIRVRGHTRPDPCSHGGHASRKESSSCVVQRWVEFAPPLSPGQCDRIATLLGPPE